MTQDQVLKILKTGSNVFLTGEPGSGKTYIINQYVSFLRSHGISPAITASTGIAATHIGGMTIHSWCGIGIKDWLSEYDLANIISTEQIKKRIEKAAVLIIDEISMLSPNVLQMVDQVCRKIKGNSAPFGGIQIVLVGDFFQLPPISKNQIKEFDQFELDALFEEKPIRFSFDAPVFKQAELISCYLTEQHRQDDNDLLAILSKIRENRFDSVSLERIKSRGTSIENISDNMPKLYSHNSNVDAINEKMLSNIPGEAHFFPMKTKGPLKLVEVMKKGCLSPEKLFLKVGASVMFTKNNAKDGYVNGTLGVVESFNDESELPEVRLRNGRKVIVEASDWSIEEDGKVKAIISQIPLRLAWAITVHKSQGISLDEAAMDLSAVFEYGQGYVALSRIKRLSGVHMLGWNSKAFQVDPEIIEKDTEFRRESEAAERIFSPLSAKKLEQMENDFIKKCGGTLESLGAFIEKVDSKPSTYETTLKLWKDKKSIKEIAAIRNLSSNTIFDHIEKLYSEDKISSNEILTICSKRLKRDLPKIQAAFKQLKTTKLAPVFEHFQSIYSYEDLKLARMLIK